MLNAFGHPAATCCDVLDVVGSNLTIFKLGPTTPNMSQHGGQTIATMLRYVALACCDSFGWDFNEMAATLRFRVVCEEDLVKVLKD